LKEDAMTKRIVMTGAMIGIVLISSLVEAQTQLSPAERGQRLYQRNCLHCHGAALDGKGPDSASFNPPPVNFHSYLSRLKDNTELETTIKQGKRFLGMHNWSETLTEEQVRDLIVYIRTAAPQVNVKP
jgi:mono/diheme cytochrome c family protein